MLASLSQIHWLAVVVAAIASMVIGFVWYLPPVFGKRWAALVKSYGRPYAENPKLDPLQPTNPLSPMGVWLIGFLVNGLVLALLVNALGMTGAGDAIVLAIFVWAGFAATLSSWPAAFAGWPWGLWLLNNICYLLMQIVMALIVTLWR